MTGAVVRSAASEHRAVRRRPTPRRGLRLVRPVTGGMRAVRARRDADAEEPAMTATAGGRDPAALTRPERPTGAVQSATDPPRFGRFAVIGRVGEGAMSTVYAAHDPALGRKVAVKLIHDDGDVDSRTRAQIEAHALARISHPNVVQIFETGTFAGQAFVAMEFIDGVTLTEWQAAPRRTPLAVVRMYVQAGRGLMAAHAEGVVHRDFKSDNVLVGRDGRARVVDFGLALIVGGPQQVGSGAVDPAASPRLTSSGTVLGTPAYMSPEQHRGGPIDERSDQFNFCAALYEALYGVRPFAGSTLQEVARQVRTGALQRPPRRTAVPRAVHRALLRGLAATPEQRWPSLAALLEQLERCDEPRARVRMPAVRPTTSAAVLAAALGAAVLGAGGLPLAGPALVGALGAALMAAGCAWLVADARLRAARRFGTP